eukprot:6206027-Pleurochrysis_carterae.AAC.1
MQVTDAPPVRSMLASPPGRSIMGPENRRRKRVLEDGAPALGIVTSGKPGGCSPSSALGFAMGGASR